MPEACDYLLAASHILASAEEGPAPDNEHKALAVSKGRIVALGAYTELRQHWQPRRQLDLGRAMLMPALINAHTHVAMTLFRGVADDLPLMEWLEEHIFPLERHLSDELTYLGAMLGCAEMIRSGIGAFQDMYLFEDAVCRAAETSGLRCLAGEVIFSFPTAASSGPAESLKQVEAQAEKWRGHPRIGIAVMPHAVYTSDPQLLRQCVKLAERLELPLHMHLAESPSETAACLNMHGKRPVPYCRELGILQERSSLAHVVDVNEDELDMLAQSGASIVHNPSSNMKLASGIAPLPAMLERKMKLALGSDGAAANNRLNIFTEMGRAALLHKAHSLNPTLGTAGQIFHAATSGGAQALGQPQLGRLAVGGPADLIALDLKAPNLQPLYKPLSHAVYAATGLETRLNMVNGEILYLDGAFSRFDYAELLEKLGEAHKKIHKLHANLHPGAKKADISS